MVRTFSAFQHGIHGEIAQVEAAAQSLNPTIHLTGLPAEVVKESRTRIRVALNLLGFDVPSRRVVIHLGPASAKKEGSHFDLPIAMALLAAEQCLIGVNIARFGFLGELGLGGEIKKVKNIIPLLLVLRKQKDIERIFLPESNFKEAGLIADEKLVLVKSLGQVIELLRGKESVFKRATKLSLERGPVSTRLDEVIGQRMAKRALQIALAGRHHLLLIGSPGVGKSMLAGVAPGLLPPLEEEELMELAVIQNAACDDWQPTAQRPFRSPHHSVSSQGFVGGGTGRIVPGELSLAHQGILFLDEFPEFRRDALEGLREPMQNGVIHIHRIGNSFVLPARFTLIAAMNPCPCGFSLSPSRRCICAREKISNYRKRISGPLLDRIDLGVVMANVQAAPQEMGDHDRVTQSIASAWKIQWERYQVRRWNGEMPVDEEAGPFALEEACRVKLAQLAGEKIASMRGRQKLIRIGRTIADLAGDSRIMPRHLEEAWALRCPELHSLNG